MRHTTGAPVTTPPRKHQAAARPAREPSPAAMRQRSRARSDGAVAAPKVARISAPNIASSSGFRPMRSDSGP